MGRQFMHLLLRCVHCVEYYRLRWGGDVGELRACIADLRFLHGCLWWFDRYDKDDNGEENWESLKAMLEAIGSTWKNLEGVLASTKQKFRPENSFQLYTWRKTKEEFYEEFRTITFRERKNWDVSWPLAVVAIENWDIGINGRSKIKETIEECKLHIRGQCANLLHVTFKYKSVPGADQMLDFLESILHHLKAFGPLNNQIETFENKLMLLQALFKLIPDDCTMLMELGDLMNGLYNDINKVAWLSFFFWAKAGDEEIAAELNLLLSDMSGKIVKPSVPDVARWYFDALKAMRSDDTLLLGQVVPGFLDLLFESLGVPLHEDFEILRDELIILFTFLANPPPKGYAEEDEEFFLTFDQLADLLREVSPVDDMEKVRLSSLMNIERLKGKIRELHNRYPDSCCCNFPRTNGLGFIDFLLNHLKKNLNGDKMFIPFAKHLIMKIEQELDSLRPSLDATLEQQKEHNELHATWLQLINLAYQIEHAVNSCSVMLYPIWYNMVHLADILDEIKVITGKLHTTKSSYPYTAAVLPKSDNEIPKQDWYSGASEVMVGCEEEVDSITDQLTRGPKSLEIVSIVGMGGSGKTTLARKVYHSQKVRSSFHIFAFCTVSQVYSTQKLLVEILEDVTGVIVSEGSKTDDDLAHLLYQHLSGKSYLVVLDDIWNIDAWEKVKSSFPNNNGGSRVIFTTRECEVAKKAQGKLRPHYKILLSDKQSWELLQTMTFHQAGCPPDLSDIGQVIARNCGGLPLAVTVIGRLLARKERSLTLWNEIAEKTTSFASEEGCTKVLELSYKHLPEHLKSCFLYLAVFQEDELIPAKRLLLLWIAEGFVKKPQSYSMRNVANEYLTELVDRSLLHLGKRSSDKGIKTCQLHDVIRDFCQKRAQEEYFFQLIKRVKAGKSLQSNQYSFSFDMEESFVDVEPRDPGIKSLLYCCAQLYYYGCNDSESIFSKFQLVQVLDLEIVMLRGGKGEIYRVLESMTSLIHLRYLAVSIGDGDIGIPSRMADLKNLETLILRRSNHAGHLWWGETFWRMERLRHLDVGRCYLIPCPPKFEAYPPLYNLECFSTLILKPGTARAVLQRLPNVRKLNCLVSSFSNNGEILALDFLSKLESLKLKVYGEKMILPVTLKKLYLYGCGLSSQLGKLPHLEVLKIYGCGNFIWEIEDGDFPELEFLKLENSILREWNAPDGSFPRLEQLVLVDCQELLEIPESFKESATLKRIEVHSSSSSLASSACEIRDEQKDLGNEIQSIISDSRY